MCICLSTYLPLFLSLILCKQCNTKLTILMSSELKHAYNETLSLYEKHPHIFINKHISKYTLNLKIPQLSIKINA